MDDNKKFWERTSKLYAPIQEHSNRKLYEAVTKRCGDYLSSDARVLELASGSGQLTHPLSPRAGSWLATDFSPRMLEQLRRRCGASVETAIADATALQYRDSSFDAVLIGIALHIMPQPEKALAECFRVLRSGGILLAPTFVYEGRPNRLRMWLTTKVGLRTYHEWTSADLADALRQAGFRVVESELLPADPLPEAFVAARKP